MNLFFCVGLLTVLVAQCILAQDIVYMGQNGNRADSQIRHQNETFTIQHVLDALENMDISHEKIMDIFSGLNISIFHSKGLSENCLKDVGLLFAIARLPSPQNYLFLQYMDASSKIPNGVLQGRWNWVGDDQECKSIQPIVYPNTTHAFKGQYFSEVFYMNGKPIFNPYPLIMGVCLPDSCSETDVVTVTNLGVNYLKGEIAKYYPAIANASIISVQAVTEKSPKLDSGAKTMVVVISVLVFIVLVSTVVDYCSIMIKEQKKKDQPFNEEDATYNDINDRPDRTGLLSGELFSPNIQEGRCSSVKSCTLKFFQAFSVVSNGKKLFSTTTANGPLACLNGIRVMSMWWVILGHTYVFFMAALDNTVYAYTFMQRFTFQPILNGTFSVDSFFFLSGLLVAYLALNEIRDKGRLNWVYYVLHRFWRLTPLYLFVILYFTFLMVHTISGPMMFFLKSGPYEESIDACKQYWWTNILYINNMYPNYGNLGTTCMGWGWYLANDMQFYLVFGPMLIIALSKFKRFGVGLGGFLIIAGVAIRAFLIWYYGMHGLQGLPTKHTDDPWGKNGALYGRPYARWSVYIVGMMTGYVLSVTKNRIRIHRVVALLGWCAAVGTGLAVIYGQYYYSHHPNTQMTLTASVFYGSLSRTAWGMCLSWVVLACVSGNGGPVKDILSWKVWAPLGRLTYSAYLVHPIVMYTFYFNMHETVHVTDLLVVYLFIGHLVISYAVAFVVSMLVEAPMIQLEKILLKPAGSLGVKFTDGISSLSARIRRRPNP